MTTEQLPMPRSYLRTFWKAAKAPFSGLLGVGENLMRLRREKPGIPGLDAMVRAFRGDQAAAEWKERIVLEVGNRLMLIEVEKGD